MNAQSILQQSKAIHPWLLWRNENNLVVQSGDEYAYEYVAHEKTYFIDTWTQKGMLVLPSKPRDGFKIIVSDRFGSWKAHPLIVHRNGGDIEGLSEHLVCDQPNAVFSLTFTTTRLGWVVGQNLTTQDLIEKHKGVH
jgi:hypothetical protein